MIRLDDRVHVARVAGDPVLHRIVADAMIRLDDQCVVVALRSDTVGPCIGYLMSSRHEYFDRRAGKSEILEASQRTELVG